MPRRVNGNLGELRDKGTKRFRTILHRSLPIAINPHSKRQGHPSAGFGHHGLALDTGQAPQLTGQSIDTVAGTLDDKRNHRHRTVLKRQPLATQNDVGIICDK